MYKFAVAFTALALVTGATAAVADDSGHASVNGLKAEQSQQNGTMGKTTTNTTSSDAMGGANCGQKMAGSTGSGAMTGCKPKMETH